MTTTGTACVAEATAFALLSDADVAALDAALEAGMARIAADAATTFDALLEAHYAERDRLEGEAHAALLAHLASRRAVLARLEAAAAAKDADAKRPAPAAATPCASPIAQLEEPVMTDPKIADAAAAVAPRAEPQPDATAASIAPQRGAATAPAGSAPLHAEPQRRHVGGREGGDSGLRGRQGPRLGGELVQPRERRVELRRRHRAAGRGHGEGADHRS
ncbi:hypothetical protein SAMN05444370_12216 [Rubrimonas cliftonensis]|uniref:Uncharacterized protein n=2 Tax=Rubrimonas cliftonensis TaxID=89524 RepID=A0A1H4FGX0_9RHOB|nr:hypothetical protein SAMN05444370_12216 [Rubrimonas cliftonensis]